LDLSPDVTHLDVNGPRMSGFEVLQRIREFSDAPVLMLTARGDEMSKVKGLEMGADDYLVKTLQPPGAWNSCQKRGGAHRHLLASLLVRYSIVWQPGL
jgi:CheY-like chemotaxis protein